VKAGWCFDAVLPSSSTPTSPTRKKSSNDGKGRKSEEKGAVEEVEEAVGWSCPSSVTRFSAGARRGAGGGEGGERRARLEGDHTEGGCSCSCSSSSSSTSRRREGRAGECAGMIGIAALIQVGSGEGGGGGEVDRRPKLGLVNTGVEELRGDVTHWLRAA